jgi:hypothetical protein
MAESDETIIKCGVEGGTLTLVGTRETAAWRFRVSTDERTLIDFLDEADRVDFQCRHDSDWVDSWEAALSLIDKYQWATLFMPLSVHPEFTSQVWKAVQERTGTGGDAWTLKEWCRLCQGG